MGASREAPYEERSFTHPVFPKRDATWTGAAEKAEFQGYADLLEWLVQTRNWTPLHHLEQLTPKRARALLRGGADLHAGAPSPLARARTVGGEVSALLLRAARWSEGSHELFPAPARAQAVAVLRLGYLLASAQYPMEAVALVDVWRHIVLPHAITRE